MYYRKLTDEQKKKRANRLLKLRKELRKGMEKDVALVRSITSLLGKDNHQKRSKIRGIDFSRLVWLSAASLVLIPVSLIAIVLWSTGFLKLTWVW